MRKNLAEWFALGLSAFMLIGTIIMIYGGQLPERIRTHSEKICSLEIEQKEQRAIKDSLMIRTAIILHEIQSLKELIVKK